MTTDQQIKRGDYLDGLLDALRARVARGDRRAIVYGGPVRIVSIARAGVRIRFADGHVERAHVEAVK